MASIVFTCKNNEIVGFNEAEELVVYDMDSKKITARLKKPRSIELLEDILEEYDPWIIATVEVDPEIHDQLREMGFKVEIVKPSKLDDYIEEVFG